MSDPSLFLLDVGHGNSAVLATSDGVVVIDAGPRTTLLEFLRQEGISRVDTVLISHADKDHIEGLISLIESGEIEIGRVRLNSDSSKQSKLWKHLLFVLEKCDTDGKIDFNVALTRKDSGSFDMGGVGVQILAPSLRLAGSGAGGEADSGRRLKTNSMSVVVRIEYASSPVVVFCGDIDQTGLEAMLVDEADPQARILVYPHHGGRSGAASEAAFAKALCEAFRPEMVIFSIGRGRHSTPQPDVVKSVREALPAVRIACTQLSEHCAASTPAQSPPHLLPHYADGRKNRACCAGTLQLDLPEAAALPVHDKHQSFIDRDAPTALCREAPGGD